MKQTNRHRPGGVLISFIFIKITQEILTEIFEPHGINLSITIYLSYKTSLY